VILRPGIHDGDLHMRHSVQKPLDPPQSTPPTHRPATPPRPNQGPRTTIRPYQPPTHTLKAGATYWQTTLLAKRHFPQLIYHVKCPYSPDLTQSRAISKTLPLPPLTSPIHQPISASQHLLHQPPISRPYNAAAWPTFPTLGLNHPAQRCTKLSHVLARHPF